MRQERPSEGVGDRTRDVVPHSCRISRSLFLATLHRLIPFIKDACTRTSARTHWKTKNERPALPALPCLRFPAAPPRPSQVVARSFVRSAAERLRTAPPSPSGPPCPRRVCRPRPIPSHCLQETLRRRIRLLRPARRSPDPDPPRLALSGPVASRRRPVRSLHRGLCSFLVVRHVLDRPPPPRNMRALHGRGGRVPPALPSSLSASTSVVLLESNALPEVLDPESRAWPSPRCTP